MGRFETGSLGLIELETVWQAWVQVRHSFMAGWMPVGNEPVEDRNGFCRVKACKIESACP
jgi:hypothetical protein